MVLSDSENALVRMLDTAEATTTMKLGKKQFCIC